MTARDLALVTADLLARVLRAVACSLVVISVLPVLLGWRSDVVMSGSMLPRLHPGDVVVTQPLRADRLVLGQIVLVENPARPGHTLVHRFVRRTPEGDLITRGDANAEPDSTPVPPSMVRGLPRLRVPWIGLPMPWRAEGRHLPLLLTALLTVAVVVGPTLLWPRGPVDEGAGVDVGAVEQPPADEDREPGPQDPPPPPAPTHEVAVRGGRARGRRRREAVLRRLGIALLVLLVLRPVDQAPAAPSASAAATAALSTSGSWRSDGTRAPTSSPDRAADAHVPGTAGRERDLPEPSDLLARPRQPLSPPGARAAGWQRSQFARSVAPGSTGRGRQTC